MLQRVLDCFGMLGDDGKQDSRWPIGARSSLFPFRTEAGAKPNRAAPSPRR